MVAAMKREGFGACTNFLECESACPKEVSVRFIAKLNCEFIRAALFQEERTGQVGGDG